MGIEHWYAKYSITFITEQIHITNNIVILDLYSFPVINILKQILSNNWKHWHLWHVRLSWKKNSSVIKECEIGMNGILISFMRIFLIRMFCFLIILNYEKSAPLVDCCSTGLGGPESNPPLRCGGRLRVWSQSSTSVSKSLQ